MTPMTQTTPGRADRAHPSALSVYTPDLVVHRRLPVMTRKSLATVILVALASVAVPFAQSTQIPVNWKGLSEPFAPESVRNNPTVIPQPEGAKLAVPAGFVVEEFMGGFSRPRFMILGPNREVLLSDNVQNGAVYVLKD